MGYLQVFGAKLEELLRTHGLTEAQCEDIVTYVKETVLQSYRNGVEKGSAAKGAPQKTTPASQRRPVKRTR
jgi:hypothetical protein